MSRSFAAGVAVLVAVLVAAVFVPAPTPVHGCAVAPPPGGSIDITSESALIVYDPATKTEHFVRTAAFSTTASADFGFLVPTPSKPELAEASPAVFGALADMTKQRTVVERRMKEPSFGCGLLPMAKHAEFATVGAASPGGVSVVERKRVGAFDAAVLKADDPKELRKWLTDNGYEARPQLEKWFEAYTANRWFLTAFKIATGDTNGAKTVNNTAVRISFQTDTPFYPYREPEDARQGGSGSRTLRLFVLTDARVAGRIGNTTPHAPFPGTTVWSNAVDAGRRAALREIETAGKLPELANGYWHLTEFEDRSSPRPGTDEVYFAASADQSAVERPPHVVYEYYDPWPWVWLAVAVFGAAFVAQLVWRSRRKKG